MKILSILICSLAWRAEDLHALVQVLEPQLIAAGNEVVEMLIYVDRKERTTGEKRNELLDQASGKYVVFIDDDDMVPGYYVREFITACKKDADCVAINGYMTTDGGGKVKWRISKDYENANITEAGKPVYLRKTNHITAVKREHALKARFPVKSNAEDKAYSEALNPYLKTEVVIEPEMYHYKFSTQNKEYV